MTSVLLGEYLAGSIIVLMLAGGEALESYALRSASSVLAALAKRMPSIAHRKTDSEIVDVALDEVAVGDTLVIYPHEICPVDGVVIEGHGMMDESYLTGEPFKITKTSGSTVISGAINGESALTIRTTKRAADSRYAKIMEVMRESEAEAAAIAASGRSIGSNLHSGGAVTVALLAWVISGEAVRFLAVLVIATPCPLLLAIPIAIIGSISLCARRAIIVKNPVVLEQIARVPDRDFRQDRDAHLWRAEVDRTNHRSWLCPKGSADPGRPAWNAIPSIRWPEPFSPQAKEEGLQLPEATEVSEQPGQGLRGTVSGHQVQITSRSKLACAKRLPVRTTFRRLRVDWNAWW